MHDRQRRGEFIGALSHHLRLRLWALGRLGSLLAGLALPTQRLRKSCGLSSRHVTRRWHAQALQRGMRPPL